MTYTITELVIILAAYVAAGIVKGTAGLGFSTFCLPILVLAVGLKEALPLIVIPSIAANIGVMIEAGAFRPTLRRFLPMLVMTIPGLMVGLWLLGHADADRAAAVLGIVLVLYSGLGLAGRDPQLAPHLERPLQPLSGFATGLINGVTGSQVMPVMPFLMALHLPRAVFVQAINCSFTMSSVIMAIGLWTLGLVRAEAILVSTIGITTVYIGIRIGAALGRRLSPTQFRTMILAVLAMIGFALIARGLR